MSAPLAVTTGAATPAVVALPTTSGRSAQALSVGRLAQWFQEGALYLLLILLPISPAAVEISFGLLLIGWIVERCDPATRGQTVWLRVGMRPVLLAILAYLGACAFSVFISDTPMLSVRALIFKWGEYLVLCLLAVDLGSRPEIVRRGLGALRWSTVLVVLEVATQVLFGRGLLRGHHIGAVWNFSRITGPYENPIDLGTYLMVAILLLLADGLAHQGRRRWGRLGWLLVLTGMLIVTEAFGALIALWLGFVVIMVVTPRVRRYGVVALVVSMVLGVAVFHRTGHLRQVMSISEIGKVDRVMMWQAALGMIRDRPLLGHGLGTFMSNYLAYWVGGERAPRYAHNCYLQVAAETGIVGLAAFLWVLWAIGMAIMGGIRRAAADDRVRLAGFLAALAAFAAQAGIDTNFYSLRQAALFWLLAGLAVGFSVRVLARDEAP